MTHESIMLLSRDVQFFWLTNFQLENLCYSMLFYSFLCFLILFYAFASGQYKLTWKNTKSHPYHKLVVYKIKKERFQESNSKVIMKSFTVVLLLLVLLAYVGEIRAGPIAGNTCCAVCCTTVTSALGPLGPLACVATCVASVGTSPPCMVCAAAFLAPTP